jgi:hypothetical protein
MFAAKNELFTTPSGYQIQRSLRFRSSATAYLSRTPASTTNQKTWTWSGWVKRGQLSGSADFTLFGSVNPGVSQTTVSFSNDGFVVSSSGSGLAGINLKTSAVFRDPSAWYHIVVAVDTTQATDTNRVKIYINGVQSTSFSASTYPTQNTNCTLNVSGLEVNIARFNLVSFFQYFDGYLAEINFIDGQALTPSSFGAINATTGVWSATRYNGTYGTNGFYLPFTDNSAATATTIGKDFSGNGNNWTPNNISVTAGVTYDSMLDAPLGAGGGERGNYTTLNPLSRTDGTVSEANLKFVGPSSSRQINGTIAVNSGKWYWEVNILNAPVTPRDSTTAYNGFGFSLATIFASTAGGTTSTHWVNLKDNGFYKNFSGTNTDSGSAISSGDVLAIAVDLDANTFAFYKNNTSIVTGTIGTTAGTSLVPAMYSYNGDFGAMACNFGQRPFSYTPPTGFKALHTGNLGAPVIALPAQYMAATTYTGTNAIRSISNAVNGVSFQPDFVWIKDRSRAGSNDLVDSVRGVNKALISDGNYAEYTGSFVSSFNSDGFGLPANTTSDSFYTNISGDGFVGWQWKGGGTAVSNTSGSITSSVSANVSAGFSVVTYTLNNSTFTVGHGLGVAPRMIIVKNRDTTNNWDIYHSSVGAGSRLTFTTSAPDASTQVWNNTAPTSTVFSGDSAWWSSPSTSKMVAYCFAPVAGYSAFGSYTGNFNADGPFVYLGFRPRYIMIKRTDAAATWFLFDTARNPTNNSANYLQAELSNSEGADALFDMLSNGFKLRVAANSYNANGGTYLYMAFAESPFKNSLAR